MPALDRRLCIAPMMGWTDRHGRALMRLAAPPGALLYSEMITAAAILHGDRRRLLAFDPAEHPLALQIAGCDPATLAEAARIGEDFGYDEINLNAGCPSCAAGQGGFGAHMMADPGLILRCMSAIRAATRLPATLKCRLGIDQQNPRTLLPGLLDRLAETGCDAVIIHARKAWLKGVSPRANRALPPLDHALVHQLARRLKRSHPACAVVINGGIASLEEAEAHLRQVDGVMIGRAAMRNPLMLARARGLSRNQLIARFADYAGRAIGAGANLRAVLKHGASLLRAAPGARARRARLDRIMSGAIPFEPNALRELAA